VFNRSTFDSADMAMRGRIGAHRLHALHDSRVVSAPGRVAARTVLDRRLLAEVDPSGKLDPEERQRRLQHARAAHFASLAFKSAIARRKKAAPAATGYGS
jgi:hypothetical protein